MPFLKKAIDKVAVRAKILNKTPLKKHKKYVKHTLNGLKDTKTLNGMK